MRVRDYRELLIFSSTQSNKFWGTDASAYRTVSYGRIGQKPRQKLYDTRQKAESVLYSKMMKGYIPIEVNDIAGDNICCEGSDTVMTQDCGPHIEDVHPSDRFHLCLGCGSRIDHSDENANLTRLINQSLHRRSYGTKGG